MRILFLSAPLLFPANTGGRIRSSEILRRVARRHEVTALCFRTPDDSEAAIEAMRACCARLLTVPFTDTPKFTPRFYAALAASLTSALPYTAWKYRNAEVRACLSSEVLAQDLLVCDFLQPAVNLPAVTPVPVVLFQHNVEAAIFDRHVAHAPNPVARAYLSLERRKLARFERQVLERAAHTVAVSDADRAQMIERYGVSNITAIPTGVDPEYWRPTGEPEGTDLVFTGSMDWIPNQDAVRYFAAEILPIIRRQVPASFVVVGRNPPASIRDLEQTVPGVRVTGTVDDVRPWVARGAVYVVPLRIGGGTRIKIFEAMSMARSVVSTTIGAEGLPVEAGRHLLVADTPDAFAAAVLRLLGNREERHRLGSAARQFVSSRFTWDAAADQFAAICEGVVAPNRQARMACV